MTFRRCKACGNSFTPWPQAKNQQFCSNPACQNERRRRKQAKRRQESLAMRESDAQYLKDWAAKNPGYWQKYRAEHATYAERNRTQQQTRNQARIAKDAPLSPNALPSGLYQLIPATAEMIAKDTVWLVEITVLQGPSDIEAPYCK